MSDVLKGLEPERVFTHFEKICSIPHGSYHVEELSNYLVNWAKALGLEVLQDQEYNVLIKKKASATMENAPTIILQGHMDMVCEKNQDVEFDFLTEGLKLQVKGDNITASGTTLGGDDGIAVAYIMAVLEDDTLVHPPIEALITTQEEVGMEGAFGFDMEQLSGTYLINLDSEEEGSVLTSCAGGATLHVEYPLELEPAMDGKVYDILISGLQGGHSGAEIHLGRGNANILMAKLIYGLETKHISFSLVSWEGGLKSNAITREAKATLIVDAEGEAEFLKECDDFFAKAKADYKVTDPELEIKATPSQQVVDQVIRKDIACGFLNFASKVTDGVFQMSEDMEGLVETSSNLGIVAMEETMLHCVFLLRSSKETELLRLIEEIRSGVFAGLRPYIDDLAKEEDFASYVRVDGRYPGWEYVKDSKLRALVTSEYERRYGKAMAVEAIHAGLECGIFASRKQLDIVSIGPDILDIHTPKETLKIASTKRTYEMLLGILARGNEL